MESESECVCRICHVSNSSPEDELISPCRCKGTAKFVHRECLNDWRRVKRRRSYQCEICEAHYRVKFIYPSVWQYMKTSWTWTEKVMYISSVISSFSSIWVSISSYRRDQLKKEKSKAKKRTLTEGKEASAKTSLELEKPISPVQLLENMSNLFFYGWPKNLKILLLFCMLSVTIGNVVLYKGWRERFRQEYILPADESKSLEELN